MEAHPVPQNVTAFEFHLIGNMTIRQFLYLAAGLAIAYVAFLLFFNTLPFLAWPIIIVSSSIGAAYAFLPIMERPLDYWTSAFIKAVRRPTLRKYTSKVVFPEDPQFKNRLPIYLHFLQSLQPIEKTPSTVKVIPIPQAEEEKKTAVPPPPPTTTPPSAPPPSAKPPTKDPVAEFMANLNKLAAEPAVTQPLPQAPPSIPPPSTGQVPPSPKDEPLPSKEELTKTVHLAKEAQVIQSQILEAEKQINEIKSGAATEGVDPKKYTQQFQLVLADLQKLNQKAREISHELAELSKLPTSSTIALTPTAKPSIIPSLTLTATPNIINGIVTDAQGNYIEGAIIVAHDKAGLPVRALKTNKLGQFIAATPLSSGNYNISVEKDDLAFDVVQIELNDKVLNPVVISAKRGGVVNG